MSLRTNGARGVERTRIEARAVAPEGGDSATSRAKRKRVRRRRLGIMNNDPSLKSIRLREQHLEAVVLRALRAMPLYALEVASLVDEDESQVARAVERCYNGGVIVARPGGRFSLA